MRNKYIMVIVTLFVCSFILMACSDDSIERTNGEENNTEGTENDDQQNNFELNNEDTENHGSQDEGKSDEEQQEKETENQDNNGNVKDISVDSVYEEIMDGDLLNEDAMEMENSNLDWDTTDLMNFSNKTISFVENKAFFTYYMNTYALRTVDNSYSEKIDVESDAQMVSYDNNLVFLQAKDEAIHLHFMDPETEKVVDTVTEDLVKATDSPLSNTFLYEDKLVGVTGIVGNIYIFDLPTKSLENVLNMEDIIGEKRDIRTLGFDEGILYMGNSGIFSSLYALDIDSGELSWELELGENNIYRQVEVSPREAIFIEDSMYVLLENSAYMELDKNTGELINAADFGTTTHLLHVTEENIFMAHENWNEEKEYIVSLNKETLEPNWAVAVDGEKYHYSAAIHDNYLYTAVLNPFMESDGTDWYKINIDTGEVLAKDKIAGLKNQNAEGLFFEIINGKMLLADGDSITIAPLE
ncbi:PQQ-binding-like beta-propeller repeat protein [Gracilibacillus kekensis]|uniref:PQQ-like domain-containing protein n=1 Tax=Gracilibacillus kekensis TaxID=1027249 RepID=A0A1M7QJE5_9BACI|nr:PQQ-binding-like beta-propeller repeat protein [Gracilibacillus kekensis]SHN31125.1 PQQ-like domain-containing protein [Gracilibacillus kekensis]